MGAIDTSLQYVYSRLREGNVGRAIMELDAYLSAWPNQQSLDRLDTLKSEYDQMVDKWKQGTADPGREEQYQSLLQRTYVLMANIAIHRHLSATSFLQQLHRQARQTGRPMNLDAVRQDMESFVSDVAMLELEPEQTRQEKSKALYKAHQQQMNQLFNFLLTSNIWSDGTGRAMEELLTVPTVDSNDQQLLVTAVTLSLMNRFDIVKFRTLTGVYSRSVDEAVRQRALIGWVLGLDDDMAAVYPEQARLVEELVKQKRVCDELTELQIQMAYTMDSDKDIKTINNEIIPDILKNQSFRLTPNGIKEVEDDPLEDVLNPDAAEQRMEKLEQSVQRMIDMQRSGADIFFSGFSQIKRYPFFYDVSNWFVPFYGEHPDIAQFMERYSDNLFLKTILKKAPFCNSDKYSFVIAFQQVESQLPRQLRESMKRGETMMEAEAIDKGEHRQPAYIRRRYLMDLFRFFRLFPNRQAFVSPFTGGNGQLALSFFFCSQVFSHTAIDASKLEVAKVFKKHGYGEAADGVLESIPEKLRNVQYYMLREQYDEVLRLDPDNERALNAKGRQLYDRKRFAEACDIFDRLVLMHPEKRSYQVYKAVCMVDIEDYEDALKILYQQHYEDEENVSICRILGWALTCAGKLEQSERMYRQLIDRGEANSNDILNMGLCQWLMGHVSEAVAYFGKYVAQGGRAGIVTEDTHWLRKRGFTQSDINMMDTCLNSL